MIAFCDTRHIRQNVYLREVVKQNGKLTNKEIQTFDAYRSSSRLKRSTPRPLVPWRCLTKTFVSTQTHGIFLIVETDRFMARLAKKQTLSAASPSLVGCHSNSDGPNETLKT